MINNYAISQVEQIKNRCTNSKPLVAVWCMAYNHNPYIEDALNGFIIQRTNFNFVAIVHDDASQDGTATIIQQYAKEYPEIILPILEKDNQYSKKDGSLDKIMIEALKSTGAKYIAVCEGDDYWIDPLKLKKQVDFLEANPDYGLTYTKAVVYDQDKKKYGRIIGAHIPSIKVLLYYNAIPTLTVVMCKSIMDSYYYNQQQSNCSLSLGDYPMWLYICSHVKWKFLDEVCGVYRFISGSASKPQSIESILKFNNDVTEISLYNMRLLGLQDSNIENQIYNRCYISIASTAVLAGHRELAKKYYKKALKKTFIMKCKELLCYNEFLFKILQWWYQK